ncbi:MAG TPA: proteasome subunit alpha [Jiangellales bacterium]|nr:proteasome subunit alpha [Jiangellales bacterium]
MQFGYVSPEQFYKDKADYARKGIARGRSVVVMQYEHGILFVAENLSRSLHKISEIYDRIAFAAAGRYPELESLRIAGVRLADLRGYSFDRADVNGRALANTYAQTLDAIFTTQPKPYEVEIAVAEVGDTAAEDQIYRLTYEGSVVDEHGFAVMGGAADQVSRHLSESYRDGMSFEDATRLAVDALARDNASGEVRQLTTDALEVAVLDRNRARRKFKRISQANLRELLGNGHSATPSGPEPTGEQAAPSAGGPTEEPPTT